MGNPESKTASLVLALIALVFGAILNTFNQPGCFALWDIMVGVTLFSIILAYWDSVGTKVGQSAAVASIGGGSIAIILGGIMDPTMLYMMSGNISKTWCDDSKLKDLILAITWLFSTIIIFAIRIKPQSSR